jgi:methylenetetrahydrofolate--tRNA-(uracil-5-)-methyltransferase
MRADDCGDRAFDGGIAGRKIGAATGADSLAFFDAIAPIVYAETINMDIAWRAARWDKGPKPASRWIGRQGLHQLPDEQGRISGLSRRIADRRKDRVQGMGGQHPYFDGCMPIEVMAERGEDTLRFGPMKPVGLDDPRTGRWPYAVVQLRQDNKLGTLFNMVGFQTKLKYAEQTRVFRMIPGLENAEFARLGGLHRNTFLNSPTLLDRQLRLKSSPHIRFAGQITGCEGYVESASVGMLAGIMTACELAGRAWTEPPRTTALGALLAHITGDAEADTYQPMNINFGLFRRSSRKRRSRKQAANWSIPSVPRAIWRLGFPPSYEAGSGWRRVFSGAAHDALATLLRLTACRRIRPVSDFITIQRCKKSLVRPERSCH